jgi:hypothetical protein
MERAGEFFPGKIIALAWSVLLAGSTLSIPLYASPADFDPDGPPAIPQIPVTQLFDADTPLVAFPDAPVSDWASSSGAAGSVQVNTPSSISSAVLSIDLDTPESAVADRRESPIGLEFVTLMIIPAYALMLYLTGRRKKIVPGDSLHELAAAVTSHTRPTTR